MSLLPPHGGTLNDLFLPSAEAKIEKQNRRDYPSWDPTPQPLFGLETLLHGAFLPVGGFTGTLAADLHNFSRKLGGERAYRNAPTQVFRHAKEDEADKRA